MVSRRCTIGRCREPELIDGRCLGHHLDAYRSQTADPVADVDLVACRVCGCTDDQACDGGCWWVPDPEGLGDLCSACADATDSAEPGPAPEPARPQAGLFQPGARRRNGTQPAGDDRAVAATGIAVHRLGLAPIWPVERPEGPLAWQEAGACVGVDADLFFPDRGASTREAKEICRSCAVRDQCLEYALANGEKFGIWGGKSERERRRIRRTRKLATQAESAAS